MFDPSVAKGRLKTGAPRTRAIWTTTLVGGFGVERGLFEDDPNPPFHFHNPHTRAIKKAGRDKRQDPADVGDASWENRPPIKMGQKTRPNTVRVSMWCPSWPPAVGFGGGVMEEEVGTGGIGEGGVEVGMDDNTGGGLRFHVQFSGFIAN
jgi:hypothetical protein